MAYIMYKCSLHHYISDASQSETPLKEKYDAARPMEIMSHTANALYGAFRDVKQSRLFCLFKKKR